MEPDYEEPDYDYNDSPAPARCSYTAWAGWSGCSAGCGSGVMSRQRGVGSGVDSPACQYTQQTKSCFGVAGCGPGGAQPQDQVGVQ